MPATFAGQFRTVARNNRLHVKLKKQKAHFKILKCALIFNPIIVYFFASLYISVPAKRKQPSP